MRELNVVYTCNAGGDISQRWYCYYYTIYRDIKARKRIYGRINTDKDFAGRTVKLLELQNKLQQKLAVTCPEGNTLSWYLKKTIADKDLYFKDSSRTYKVHVNLFIKYLVKAKLSRLQPHELTAAHIHSYQNDLLKTGRENRTVNNYLDSIKTAIKFIRSRYLVKMEVPFREKLPHTSQMHVAYTEHQMQQLSDYIKGYSPELLFYIRFVAYAFLRCTEIRKLRIRDIDFDRMIIKMPTRNVKTNSSRNKKILELFHQEVKQLQDLPGHYFVFGRNRQSGPTHVGEKYFSNIFKTVKKKFGLGKLHTLYGFRHTIVSMLIKNKADKYDVMKYTGHTTLAAFENYIRSIYAVEPVDLSDKITVKI